MQGREASLDSKFEQAAEAERLLVWAKRATQLCSATKSYPYFSRIERAFPEKIMHPPRPALHPTLASVS
jgi:hypothetical protein